MIAATVFILLKQQYVYYQKINMFHTIMEVLQLSAFWTRTFGYDWTCFGASKNRRYIFLSIAEIIQSANICRRISFSCVMSFSYEIFFCALAIGLVVNF